MKHNIESQHERIRVFLEEGNIITPMDALNLFGCMRLASRINDLRKEGLDIYTKMVFTPDGKRWASYKVGAWEE